MRGAAGLTRGAASCSAAGRDTRHYLCVVAVGRAHAASASDGAPSTSCSVPRLKYASALDGARASCGCGARGAGERAAQERQRAGGTARAAGAPIGCRHGALLRAAQQSAASRRGRSAFPRRTGATGARRQRCAQPQRGLPETAAPDRAQTTHPQMPDGGAWCVRSSQQRRRACHRFGARAQSAPARRDRRGQHTGTRCGPRPSECSCCGRARRTSEPRRCRTSAVVARSLETMTTRPGPSVPATHCSEVQLSLGPSDR